LANGTDGKYWDGTSGTGDIATFPTGIDKLAVTSTRVLGAKSTDDVLYISALGKYNDWTTADDAGEIQMYTETGEFGSGLTYYNDHPIYFKKHAMFEIYGTGPNTFNAQMISDRIGCVAHRSIKEVQGYLFWLGEEGIYMYGGGTTPQLISYPFVEGTIDTIDWTNVADACAGTDGDRYYLCLPVGSNTRQIITYDVKMQSWHLEDTSNFVQFVEFNGDLYGMGSDGQIKKMIGSAGETITHYWVSKRFSNRPSDKQSVRNIYVRLTLPTGSALKCAVKTNEGAFVDVKTFSTSTDIQNQQIRIPLTVAQNADWYQIKFYGTGACIIYSFEVQSRIRGNTYG